MKISKYILNLCVLGFIASACEEPKMESVAIPIQFSTSAKEVTISDTRSTRTEDDDSEALIINQISDLKDKDITLYGREYANSAGPNWDFIPGWNATVKASGSNYVFDYATNNHMKYYKPEDGLKYDFTAVFPSVNTNNGVSTSSRGFPFLEIQLEYRPDLMVADSTGIIKPTVSPVVIPLKFEHQLALITFNIYKDIKSQTTPEAESHNIYLNKMTLAGRTIADFNVTTKEFIPVDGISGATIRVPGYPYSDFLVKKEPQKIRDIFLFASNGNEATEQYTFDFIINEKNYKAILPASDKVWEAGKHYIYNMKVVGSDVYIELGNSGDEAIKLIQEKWNDNDMEEEVGIIEGN